VDGASRAQGGVADFANLFRSPESQLGNWDTVEVGFQQALGPELGTAVRESTSAVLTFGTSALVAGGGSPAAANAPAKSATNADPPQTTADAIRKGAGEAGKGTDVYRVVEKAELDDIERTGAFRFREGSSTPEPGIEGKWFYESLDDADVGASRIMRPSERAATVKVTVPEEALKHPFPNVDGVQRVQFIEMDELSGLPIRRVD